MAQQITYVLQVVGVDVLYSILRKRLHQQNLRGYLTHYKPLVILNDRQIRLQYPNKEREVIVLKQVVAVIE